MDMAHYREYQLEGSQYKYVLDLVKEKINLLNAVLERIKRWLGHILRGESLAKEVIE